MVQFYRNIKYIPFLLSIVVAAVGVALLPANQPSGTVQAAPMTSTTSTGSHIYPQWRASASSPNCDGPTDSNGRYWYEENFDDSGWELVTPPMTNDVGLTEDRFYRTVYTAPSTGERLYLSAASDDGIWIYINGQFVGHWGGGCHDLGCVGNLPWACDEDNPWRDIEVTQYINPGAANIIAVQVSNWDKFNKNHGNWSYFSLRLYTSIYLPIISR